MVTDFSDVMLTQGFSRNVTQDKPERSPFVVLKGLLSPAVCEQWLDAVFEEGSKFVYLEDHAYGDAKDEHISARSLVLNTEHTQELENRFFNALVAANDLNFGFPNIFVEDGLYVNEYLKGDYRTWHFDGCYTDGELTWINDILKKRNRSRVLTMVVQMNDPSEFKGGKLEIFGVKDVPALEQGDAIAFPAYWYHQVSKVVKGQRYSLCGFMYSNDHV